jgi:hypothetical protein
MRATAQTRMIPVRAAAQCPRIGPPVHNAHALTVHCSLLVRCSQTNPYQRERPRSLARRSRGGLALSTLISRSSTDLPFNALMAAWAA